MARAQLCAYGARVQLLALDCMEDQRETSSIPGNGREAGKKFVSQAVAEIVRLRISAEVLKGEDGQRTGCGFRSRNGAAVGSGEVRAEAAVDRPAPGRVKVTPRRTSDRTTACSFSSGSPL